MDTIDFNWLNDDGHIMDSLVGLAGLTEEPTGQATNNNAATDIFQYLLQPNDNSNSSNFEPVTDQQISPHPEKLSNPVENAAAVPATSSNPNDIITDPYLKSAVSVIQAKDNFVTFMPMSVPVSQKQSNPKRTKFKEPIFVTESPQSYMKKKKLGMNSSTHSSGDENSDDDMVLDEELASSHVPASKLKQMTSKERRQLRNKISARNFRVRRKEYITQLEETVEKHEKTIRSLKDENAKLRKSNEEIMKQVLSHPITPPSTSGDELLSTSSSSGSEGHHSPEHVPSMFQFQLNDIYDFNLFDPQALTPSNQQTQQQPMPSNDFSNMFFLNHAVMPDWDIHQVLGEKGNHVTSEEHQRQLSRELITDYPLLAPALMSIILRHTLSMEYVASLAKEYKETLPIDDGKCNTAEDDQVTLRGVDMEDLKASFKSLKIEESKKDDDNKHKDNKITEENIKKEASELTEGELTDIMLTKYFSMYVIMRTRGLSHQQIIERCRECLKRHYLKKALKEREKQNKQKDAENKSSKWSSNTQTLQAYCRVASSLLRRPQRMTRVSQVLKKEIEFTQNKHTVRIENRYRQLMNGHYKNQCITSTPS